MNRGLVLANLVGAIALAILCGFQWQTNRAVNLEIHDLEKSRQTQQTMLDERDRAIKGCTADLDSFRARVSSATTELAQTAAKSTDTERAVAQAAHERDTLKANVAEWTKAMAARDHELQAASAQLRALATERNDVVAKFNSLGEKYNQIVQTLNERTRQYNELVEKVQKAAP